ncbi:hypothetical protein [Rhizobium ruizarguesonis]|uniref:hypothetical protein n=1 Tax=Rhizobium ruizarguesonis TaxID=2081791 RepID=UPI0013EE426B|nr:hypothetical protein [Rhizobium ruizarguesonis]
MFQAIDYRTAKRPLETSDVVMLRAVLRNYCAARQLDRDSSAALAGARELIRLFQDGVSDGECLRELLDVAFPRN